MIQHGPGLEFSLSFIFLFFSFNRRENFPWLYQMMALLVKTDIVQEEEEGCNNFRTIYSSTSLRKVLEICFVEGCERCIYNFVCLHRDGLKVIHTFFY